MWIIISFSCETLMFELQTFSNKIRRALIGARVVVQAGHLYLAGTLNISTTDVSACCVQRYPLWIAHTVHSYALAY